MVVGDSGNRDGGMVLREALLRSETLSPWSRREIPRSSSEGFVMETTANE